VIVQQESIESTVATGDQSRPAVVKRQDVLEKPLTFEKSTISNWEVHHWSELFKRVLQELPEGQKEVLHLASKGISRRETAARSKIPLATGKRGVIWLSETPGGC
jgi:hypothetical protein